MKFETRHSIGDEVVSIVRTHVELPPETCSACEGSGSCDLRGERFACPKCKGKKTTQSQGWGWVISDAGVVGKIEVTTRLHGDDPDDREEWDQGTEAVRYMLTSTGSGRVYDEPSLWRGRDAAQAECDRRNAFDRKPA